ncbi:hypothetical protein DMENIID0001_110850 [Sergentomyia squamirostris]
MVKESLSDHVRVPRMARLNSLANNPLPHQDEHHDEHQDDGQRALGFDSLEKRPEGMFPFNFEIIMGYHQHFLHTFSRST